MYDFPISFRFRDYCVFLNITYPEIAIPDGFQYTRIPGWESTYKTHIPFLSTVTDVVYPLLLEVLENDAKRLIHFMHISLQVYFFQTSNFNLFFRLLHFQVHEDSSNPVSIVPQAPSLTLVHSPPKKKTQKERRSEAAKLKKEVVVNTRDFLNPTIFLNFQYLMPDMQILMLERIKTFYTSKQKIIDDIAFFFPVSVSCISV